MRLAFVHTLTELARRDKNVWLVTGDLGFSVFEDFIKEFPEQYLNAGVAEQNLMGLSAGLALAGKRPYVYSISTFASMRAYEQIRNDICYQNLPVVIIGGGSTFSYSTFGCTHMPLEDFSIMRTLPNMTVLSPGDPLEVSALLEQTYTRTQPTYMRIAKRGEPVVHDSSEEITLGTASCVAEGSDVTIMSTGRLLPTALSARQLLAEEGISARVLSMHTIKPLDSTAVLSAASQTKGIVTCEEHSTIGGLGSAVLETLAQHSVPTPVSILGVRDEFPKGVGSQDYFLKRYQLTPEGIRDSAKKLLGS